MKVYIGPYINWIGPYQIANKIPFIGEETRDKIGGWLAKTWVNGFCEWIESKRHRKIKVRIDNYDTWSMDYTLAMIVLPMLKQLKATKVGSQLVDDEDLPVHMNYHDNDEEDFPTTNWVHHRWDWIMNELIWTFEQLVDGDWQRQYTIQEGEIDFDDYPEDEGKDYSPLRWKKKYIIDHEGLRAHQQRITNGLRLFGKYYQGLWD